MTEVQGVRLQWGSNGWLRPRRLAEEAPAASRGKRSHSRKSPAVSKQYLKIKDFSVVSAEPRRTKHRPAESEAVRGNHQWSFMELSIE